MRTDPDDIRKSHMKVVFMGLIMNLVIPGVLVGAGVGLKNLMGAGDTPQVMEPNALQTLFYALMFVSLSEGVAVYFLRKKLLKPLEVTSGTESAEVPTVSQILAKYTILYMIAMSCSIYGFIYYVLGGQFEYFILFTLVSLLTFRLIRPQAEFYYSLFGEQSAGGAGL
jgi:hypothetical protein